VSVLKTRVITAIIFGAIMLTGLFWNETSFFILFFIISMGCLWEFLGLTLKGNVFIQKIISLILASFFYIILSTNFSLDFKYPIPFLNPSLNIGLISIGLTIFILLLIELFYQNEQPFSNIASIALGFFYPFLPFAILYKMSFVNNEFTPNIVAGILFLNWANDSGAYLIGSRIGKTPLFPRISPKKTWEGTIGGAIFCLIIGYVLSLFFKELNTFDWVVLGGIVAVFGTLGDLIESMLKRSVGVKDSGSFMPGHGGFLDRFDAFIFSIPFAYLYLIFRL
jgi:phosphatidate cytidylyltransferase